MTTMTPQTMGFRRRVSTHLAGTPGNGPHVEGPPSPLAGGGAEKTEGIAISPLRKAAIVLVSLEQSSASHLLSHLDRAAVEAVTWEIARLDRVDPAEQEMVLEEFFGLGLRRLCFVFDDLMKMGDEDIRRGFHAGDAARWALSLASASAPLRAKVLGSLAPPSAQLLRQALQDLGPFRLADAEASQMEIAERFRDLSDQGVVVLPDPSGQDDLLA